MAIDYQDVMLEAQAEVQAIMREVMTELIEPQMLVKMEQLWNNSPDKVKELFKQERPEDYAALMNEIKRR